MILGPSLKHACLLGCVFAVSMKARKTRGEQDGLGLLLNKTEHERKRRRIKRGSAGKVVPIQRR